MAEENTTDSTQTQTGDQTPAPEDTNSSTTETKTPEEGGTILTEKPAEEKGEEKPAESKGEEKPAEEKGEEEKPAENAELFGAPEGEYEIEGLPEDMEVDKAALEAMTPVAKQLGLSNKGMSVLAQTYAEKILPQVTERLNEGLERDIAAQHKAWADETNKLVQEDEVFAGKKLSEVQQVSAKALDRFAGPEFREFLDQTGLGNHPALVKFSFLAGSAISEDTTFERGNAVPSPKSRVEKYYGSQT